MKLPKKAYHVFDLDGTLIDSMRDWSSCMVEVLAEEGIQPPEGIVKIITPLGYKGTAEYYKSLGAKSSVSEMMDKMREKLKKAYSERIPLKPYVKEYLDTLNADGINLYVMTASPHIMADAALKRNGIYDYFKGVWTTEDTVATKSNPDCYPEVAEKIGCTISDFIFYEDNEMAIKAAKAAGVFCVGIYDEVSDMFCENIKNACDVYVESYKDLIK